MEKYSEVIGLPVICVDNGKKIGTIKDLVFCTKHSEVRGLLLERKGCSVRKKIILFKDVKSLGRDAAIVDDCLCVKKLSEVKEALDADKGVKGFRVYSRKGDEVGIVEDVLFDSKTGRIEGLLISGGLFEDILKGRNILPLIGDTEFGDENILVSKEALEEMSGNGRGLKNLLEKKIPKE